MGACWVSRARRLRVLPRGIRSSAGGPGGDRHIGRKLKGSSWLVVEDVREPAQTLASEEIGAKTLVAIAVGFAGYSFSVRHRRGRRSGTQELIT